jgi:DNA-binding GntR family transcriptional regulator
MAKSDIPRTVKISLVETLRDEIIRGDLAPGEYLRLEEIAARFDVSTMPVREALRDLEAEGLVTIFPHRGASVTKLSADEVRDIYDIRVALEEMATRLAVPLMTEATLAELTSLVERMENAGGDVVTVVETNHQFHLILEGASGRRHLCELNRMLRYRTQHYLHLYIVEVESGHLPQTKQEHRAILEACKRGDAEAAAALIRDHVGEVGDAIVEYVRQRNSSESSSQAAT